MRPTVLGFSNASYAVFAVVCMLAAGMLLFGCQKGESEAPDEAAGLLRDMKAWFEATDYEASGYSSPEEALDDIYQDEGYTAMLYNDIAGALKEPGSGEANRRAVLRECQEWFELIDYEMSGYDTLEEAIEDIFQDGGGTLELYNRLVEYNGEGA